MRKHGDMKQLNAQYEMHNITAIATGLIFIAKYSALLDLSVMLAIQCYQ